MLQVLDIVTCGGLEGAQIDSILPQITSTIVTIIKFVVPILLIIFGMLDLGKAVMAQKDDDIKKGQQTFLKRVIAAIIVFFVVAIVQLVISLVAGAGNDKDNIMDCFNCFISNECGR